VHTAIDRLEDVWRRMPSDAWSRPTAARIGSRPAWMSVWARWRESEIHHVDLVAGYAHGHWPAEFVDLLLPRVMPTLATRLDGEITVQAETIDRDRPVTMTAANTAGDLVIVRGPASAVLCWLLGRASAAAGDLEVTRFRAGLATAPPAGMGVTPRRAAAIRVCGHAQRPRGAQPGPPGRRLTRAYVELLPVLSETFDG
jgi:hypothetical protein